MIVFTLTVDLSHLTVHIIRHHNISDPVNVYIKQLIAHPLPKKL